MAASMKIEMGTSELRSPEAIKATVAEFIATMFFVFIGVGSIASFIATAGGGGILMIAVAHGLAIGLLVAAIGPISGGHINPAVTIATVITNRISVTRGGMYIVAQLLGAVLGALLLKLWLDSQVLDQIPGAGGHQLDHNTVKSQLAGMGIEAFLTGLLVWTVFATAIDSRGNAIIAPLAIGFAILVIHLVAIPLTGAGVNPARTFGPQVVFNRWHDWWIYYVGPILGGSIAGLLYYYLYMMEGEKAAATPAPAQ
ncbi:MAG TPA: MIP family channel protein [Dehalococcoidia bacterium]